MSRRLVILAVLIVGTAYASLLSRNWPSRLDPTFIVSGASTVTGPPPPPPPSPTPPTLTSISPAAGARGSTITVVATGSNFASNTGLVFLDGQGPPFISAGSITVLSTTMMTADVIIPSDVVLQSTTPPGVIRVIAITNAYSSDPLTFTVTDGLGCDIQMNKGVFTNGDTVIAQSVHVTNASTLPQQINYRFWLDMPNFPPAVFSQGGADGSVVLTPGFNSQLGPIPLFQISEPLPRGTYAFGCRFVDTVRGNVLAESVQPFFVQ